MHNYLSSAVLLLLLQWQTAVLFLFVRSVQSSGKCRNLKLSLLRKIHTRTPGAIFVGHSMPSDPQNNDYYGHFALFTLSDAEFFALHAPTSTFYAVYFIFAICCMSKQMFGNAKDARKTLQSEIAF